MKLQKVKNEKIKKIEEDREIYKDKLKGYN